MNIKAKLEKLNTNEKIEMQNLICNYFSLQQLIHFRRWSLKRGFRFAFEDFNVLEVMKNTLND